MKPNKFNIIGIFILFGSVFFLMTGKCHADTIHVDIRADCPGDGSQAKPYHNLTTAVNAAEAGDIMIVQSRIYPVDPQESLIISKPLIITASGGPVVIGQGQTVFLEIDKMQGTEFPPKIVTATSTGCSVSHFELFDDGGLALDVIQDNSSISPENEVTRQRLHQLMTANRNPAYEETSKKWSTYIIVVKKYQPDPDVLGVMFDYGADDLNNLPREGCAVFYDAHSDGWSGQRLKDELFLTSAHELGHCFNLHHTDWEGTSFEEGSTIMSYSLTPDVLWKISDRSFKHFTLSNDHPIEYVKPGDGAKDFGTITVHHCNNHQSTPFETYTCE